MSRGLVIGSSITLFGGIAAWYFLPTRNRVLRIAKSQLGETRWEKYLNTTALHTPAQSTSWCGLFALWVLHQAGLGKDVLWSFGTPDSSGTPRYGFLYRLPRTNEPKPGDIAYIDQPYQHHAIVEKVDGDLIHTIDGNSGGSPSLVKRNVRPRSAFTSFYSIKPWSLFV